MMGLLGRKLGMTQIADLNGRLIPVTVIQAGPVTVTKVAQVAKEGYDALQVGFEDIAVKKLTRASAQNFEKKKLQPKRYLKEFRLKDTQKIDAYKVGQELTVEIFQEGEFVDVQGTSIGKGFQGTIKRWNQSRGPESHGSMYHRRPGSAGASSFPSRTWKGHHLPGRMGGVTRSVQNLLVMKVLKEENALLVKGSVPGFDQAVITVRKSLKRREKINLEKIEKVATTAAKVAKKPVKKK